jgi:hypothetical protein
MIAVSPYSLHLLKFDVDISTLFDYLGGNSIIVRLSASIELRMLQPSQQNVFHVFATSIER